MKFSTAIYFWITSFTLLGVGVWLFANKMFFVSAILLAVFVYNLYFIAKIKNQR